MLGGVKSAIQVAAALLGVLTGLTAFATGGDLLLVVFWIGVVGGMMLIGTFWLAVPFWGVRTVVGLGVGRKVWPGDWPWFAGLALSFIAGLLVAAGRGEKLDSDADAHWGFWHWYGAATLLVVLLVGIGTYWRWYTSHHKTCPDCASTVPSVARVCKYCSYEFEVPARPDENVSIVPGPQTTARPTSNIT